MRRSLFLVLFAFWAFIPSTAFAASGKADLRGTAKDSPITGQVLFEETKGGLKVTADLQGVPPGKHGFHIHENGSCSDEGNAAGGHYNPHGTEHGFLPKDGLKKAHTGDMGNFEAGADGSGHLEVTLKGVTMGEPPDGVRGRAIILHEKEDDFGQPTGNAGKRIGCGVIDIDLTH